MSALSSTRPQSSYFSLAIRVLLPLLALASSMIFWMSFSGMPQVRSVLAAWLL